MRNDDEPETADLGEPILPAEAPLQTGFTSSPAISFGGQYEIDTASLDGMPGHHRVARRFRLLREGEPARIFDLADSEGAVRVGT